MAQVRVTPASDVLRLNCCRCGVDQSALMAIQGMMNCLVNSPLQLPVNKVVHSQHSSGAHRMSGRVHLGPAHTPFPPPTTENLFSGGRG